MIDRIAALHRIGEPIEVAGRGGLSRFAGSLPHHRAHAGDRRRLDGALMLSVQEQFGQIDIYVFDQILRGNIAPGMRVLDAGCGYGRNLVYLLREGCEIFALDADADGVEHVRQLSASLRTGLAGGELPGRVHRAHAISGRVCRCSDLQFSAPLCPRRAAFPGHVGGALASVEAGRDVVLPLGSRIGMDFERVRGNIFVVGDGSEWFLVDEEMLLELTEEMNGVLVDPLKTTIVQDYRCMTTWVLRKRRN